MESYLVDKIQFDIDNDLRIISIPKNGNVLGVIGDNNTNRINFRMPKYYNGFDMSKFIFVVCYLTPDGRINYCDVEGIGEENEYLYFTWLVGSDVTQYSGNVYFSIKLALIDGEQIKQLYNTTMAEGYVLDGIQADYIKPEQHWIEDYIATDADIASYLGLSMPAQQKVDNNYVSDYLASDEDTKTYLDI